MLEKVLQLSLNGLMAGAVLGAARFIEVFLSADLAVCERRDPRGLYRRARAGEIPDFTGISAPYEAPERPDLEVDTGVLTVEQSMEKLQAYILPRLRDGHAGR